MSKPVRSRALPTVAERLAIIETTLESLPERIGAAVASAVADLVSKGDHNALDERVAELETRFAAMGGAAKERRAALDVVNQWAIALFPYAMTVFGFLMAFRETA